MAFRDRLPRLSEPLVACLLFAAFIAIQVLIGGTRMVFSLPSYIVVGIAGLLTLSSLRRIKPPPCRACLIATAIAFTYILARALLSPSQYIARSDIYSALAALVVYFVFALIVTDNRTRMFFVVGLLVFALVHVFIGAVQFREGNNFMPISWLRRYDYGARASGYYICPNHLAGLLEALAITGLSIACWSRWPVWGKLLIGYAVACCYAGLILTGSRGGFISAGASLVTFAILSLLVLRKANAKLFLIIGGSGALAAVVIGLLTMTVVRRSHSLATRAENLIDTSNIRRDLWDAALREWKTAPRVGTGSGTYLYYGRYFRNPGMQRDPVYVHNDYLHLLAEYGIIGALGIGAMILLHGRRALRNFARLGPKRLAASQQLLSNGLALNIGAISALSAYAVHEALDFNLHIPANALLMAFVFALLANDGVVRERQSNVVSRQELSWRLALTALAFVLAIQSARLLPGEYFSERARVAVRDNHPAIAILNATRGLRFDPRNPDLAYRLGMARMEFGDAMKDPVAGASFYNDAVNALAVAHELAPLDATYALQLATALDAAERFAEAEWIFYEALQLDPRSESLRRYYDAHLRLWQRETNPPPAS